VTEISGRGLGLGIVRASVERLGGQVSIRSQSGQGTVLELSLPASMSTYPALAVQCGGTDSLIPFSAVRSAFSLRAQNLAHTVEGERLLVNGEAIPYASLAVCLGQAATGRLKAGLVLQMAGGVAAIGVDRILGVREAVVLPLPVLAPAHALVAGACLDASGVPGLVLDPEGLIGLVGSMHSTGTSPISAVALPLLVIDDSLTTRMLEQSILETAGYQVVLAASAEEGLAKLKQGRFGLILVDLEMPGMNGLEFLESVGKNRDLRGIPAIMVSSRSSAEDLYRAKQAGAVDYITKGEFNQDKLLKRIRELLV